MALQDKRTALLTGHQNSPDTVTTPSVQKVSIHATAGQFKLTLDGQTTADIAFNASAAAVKTAVQALSNVDDAEVLSVTGGPGDATGSTPYVITLAELANVAAPTPAFTITNGTTPLSGGTGSSTVTVTGGNVQAHHDTTVITDPTDPLAVQKPVAQQVGGLDLQGKQSPEDQLP